MRKTLFKAVSAFAIVGAAGLAQAQDMPEGDPAAGEKAFRKCMACHAAETEQNKVGPYLKGIIGRDIASVDGFNYSSAMKEWAEGKGAWTEELMFSYLEQPMQTVKGTRMAFPGLKDPQERADVVAYLAQVGG
jgi:cytochrome c